MFKIFQNSIEKEAKSAANNFYKNLLLWSRVIGPEKIKQWAEVEKYSNFEDLLNICFNQVQLIEGFRIIDSVASRQYADYFGEEVGRLMRLNRIDLMKIFYNLVSVKKDVIYMYNPTVPIAKWILLNTLDIENPSKNQLSEVAMDVHLASSCVLNLLKSSCPTFQFSDELIIKEYDPNETLDTFLLRSKNI